MSMRNASPAERRSVRLHVLVMYGWMFVLSLACAPAIVRSQQASDKASTAAGHALTAANNAAAAAQNAIASASGASGAALTASGAAATVSRNVKAQRANRVANVLTWCSAINATRDDQRSRVRFAITHNPTLNVRPYTLADLPCKAIAKQTSKSGGKLP